MKLACPCGSLLKTEVVGVIFVDRTDSGVPIAIYNADLKICKTCSFCNVLVLANKPIHEGPPSVLEKFIRSYKESGKIVYGA